MMLCQVLLSGGRRLILRCANRTQRQSVVWIVVFVVVLLQGSANAQTRSVRRVLILNEVGNPYPAINLIDRAIRESLDGSPYRIEYYHEYLDTLLFPDPSDQKQIREFIVRKYQKRRPDVIITVGSSALKFMVESHRDYFPGIPVVFCLSNELEKSLTLDPDFIGVQGVISAGATVQAALQLLPGAKRVVVVAGTGDYDRTKLAAIKYQLDVYKGRIEISYLTDLTMPVLLERLKRLPPHSIVLLASVGRDAAGRQFSSSEVGPLVSTASIAPVFSLLDVYLGHGEVGGDLSSVSSQGRVAGNIALRILNGARHQNIPTPTPRNNYVFDWQAMKRWGLKPSNLPPGSVVLNRRPTVWDLYKWYIVTAIALVLIQTSLIVGLAFQRRKRRIAETRGRESEERFRRLANTAPVMIWQAGPDKLCTYFNQPWLDFTGRSLESELGHGWGEGIYPEDMTSCLETYTRAFDLRKRFEMQYRLRRYDGEYRWVLDIGVPRFNRDASFAGYIGSCIDVTERKIAEEALATLGQRLIEAHEEERTRIGRELHDDISQRLAVVAIQLDRMEQRLPLDAELHNRMHDLQEQVRGTTDDVRSLSHGLHSSQLEYLGLAVAAESFCSELAEQQNLQIDFTQDAVPHRVPREISLCLFRVLQEALRNAVKHSGVRHFVVQLPGTSGEIQLTVSDSGTGFEERDGKSHLGLGLISMRERLQMVRGEFFINSRPGHGTTICARVPFDEQERRTHAA